MCSLNFLDNCLSIDTVSANFVLKSAHSHFILDVSIEGEKEEKQQPREESERSETGYALVRC